MARRDSPPSTFYGLPPVADGPRDVVIKVKYGGTLKRFNACVNGSNFDHNLAALRSKIANAFKFSSVDELILTYTDEDGDGVMLDDDDDLRDAAISQKLNPLRIDVQLKSSSAGAPQAKQQASNSKSKMSAAMEDQLAQVKSAIDEALKFVPEQVPVVLAKLSHELRSKAASSAPPVAELLDRIAKLMTPKSGMQPTSGLSDSPSGSSSGNPQTLRDMKNNHESASATVSASHLQHAKSSRALGLKSVLVDKTNAQVEQAPGCTSIGVPSALVGSGGKLLYHKKRTDAQSKGKSHAQSTGKSVVSSSVPPVPSFAYGGSTLGSATGCTPNGYVHFGSNGKRNDESSLMPPVPSFAYGGPTLGSATGSTLNGYMPFGSNGKIKGDSRSVFSPPRAPLCSSVPTFESNPRVPRHCPVPTHGLQKAFPPPPAYDYNQFWSSRHSSVQPSTFYQDPYSFSSYSQYGIPEQSIHKWVECDGCGVTPIVGPRYKSTVKYNYDLCGDCFSWMGNEAEYTRMDKPLSACERLRDMEKSQGRILQLDCCFIKDLTVPDGTRMAPSTPFRKIWCMRNNGSTVWPFGTHLVWTGGDQFSRQSSVKLEIPEAGFPLDGEIDVYVDFVAPAKPGRYISYWRLTSPDLQKFGQQVWVLIQVEQPIQASGENQTVAMNLNLPADSNPKTSRPSTMEHPVLTSGNKQTAAMNFLNLPTTSRPYIMKYPVLTSGNKQTAAMNLLSSPAEGSSTTCTTDSSSDTDDDAISLRDVLGALRRKGPKEVGSVVPSAPAADEPVQVPIDDHHTLSAEALRMPAGVPASEAAPLPKPFSVPKPLPAPAPVDSHVAPVSMLVAPAPVDSHVAPVSVAVAPLPNETINNNMEEKLLRELADMGFRQVDLNKEVLRQNDYDLQKALDDLCGFHEWDPLHAELRELGFDDDTDIKEVLRQGP